MKNCQRGNIGYKYLSQEQKIWGYPLRENNEVELARKEREGTVKQ